MNGPLNVKHTVYVLEEVSSASCGKHLETYKKRGII